MASSRLLPHSAQVATPKTFYIVSGSNLASVGSRWVAAWVATRVEDIFLIYGIELLMGSRCSTFFNKLCTNKKRQGKKRIRVTIGVSCYTCYPGIPPLPSLAPPGRDLLAKHNKKRRVSLARTGEKQSCETSRCA
jgi:hypothetical protein